ncbi:serine/threonine-protein kinase LMTK1 [Pteropus vampyrus]|uniref:non-specific serine/threonine protein kinase n=1 Tax=Pteropus vampyrus TaxID=132908 RepID=A0A6P6D466_PTEVA|nr:serine/threonine-protein kinase LMTK1 [Pteropus vampyrus]
MQASPGVVSGPQMNGLEEGSCLDPWVVEGAVPASKDTLAAEAAPGLSTAPDAPPQPASPRLPLLSSRVELGERAEHPRKTLHDTSSRSPPRPPATCRCGHACGRWRALSTRGLAMASGSAFLYALDDPLKVTGLPDGITRMEMVVSRGCLNLHPPDPGPASPRAGHRLWTGASPVREADVCYLSRWRAGSREPHPEVQPAVGEFLLTWHIALAVAVPVGPRPALPWAGGTMAWGQRGASAPQGWVCLHSGLPVLERDGGKGLGRDAGTVLPDCPLRQHSPAGLRVTPAGECRGGGVSGGRHSERARRVCPAARQPGRSVQLLKSADLGRHSLLYLEEIGRGWFGKVFLGEVNSGIGSTQVVVKELKASASVHEQMRFLEEAQPYRALQHGNLLQCLAQCAEVTPYLLVMESCPMGDLKGYLRSCRAAEPLAPDPVTLQRMACEVSCGVLHLHRNNYVHSDLALRNCLLTADLTVKIGDYGLSHGKYREDYFVTADQLWVPLRWIAPELVDEVHSNLLVVDQTKASNPPLGQVPFTESRRGHCDYCPSRTRAQDPPRTSRSPPPEALTLVEPGVEDTNWGVATFCPPFFEDPLGTAPSGTSGVSRSLEEEEEPGEVEAHKHWSCNVSANNSSRGHSRAPESWAPGHAGSHADRCPGRKHPVWAVPELGHPLAPEDPRAPLLGPEGASFGQEPGRCLGFPHLCPAEGLAPATSLVTSPWTEAAVCGANSPQTEPRLAEEAEGSAGHQLPLPSIPSPSQEGAPLPTEEAIAPTTLPASPTPASSGAAATWTAQTLDSSSSSRELEAPGSEDEDTTEATSGIFTDVSSDGLQAEKLEVMPAFRSLQKQVGTPDSLDSLDIPSSASDGGCEVFSPSAVGPSGGQPRALDSGYDTENYESPEFVLREAHEPCEPEALGELAMESESRGAQTRFTTSPGGLNEKNPYRDSAYFSDLDAELETPVGPEKRGGGVWAPGPEPDLDSPHGPGLQLSSESGVSGVPGEMQSPSPGEVPPLPLGEDSSSEPCACSTSPRPEPPRPQSPAQVPPLPSPQRSKVFLLTPVPPGSENHRPGLQEARGLLSALPTERTEGPGTPRTPLCLALPGLPATPESRPEEEEEDSEDSDESDEELRCYSTQEPSEESEEEAPPVPVVVAERQSARSLRSLLKMPSLLSEAFREDLERKKKAVSFFDDVTVYLFDQSVAVFRLHQLGQTREPHPAPGSGLLPLGPAAEAKVDSLDDGGLLVHTPADMAPF